MIRVVEGLEGEVRMTSELTLRFDYGSIVPWVRRRGDELEAVAGPDSVWFWTTAPVEGRDLSSVSDFVVREGERVPFVLTWGRSHEKAPHRPTPSTPSRTRWSSGGTGTAPRRSRGTGRRPSPGPSSSSRP